MNKIAIVDLDGTLSRSDERDAMIKPRMTEKDWEDYHKGLMNDKPNMDIYRLVEMLGEDYMIWIVTARPLQWHRKSQAWLDMYAVKYDRLIMRGNDDYRPSPIVKVDLVNDELARRSQGRFKHHDQIRFIIDDHPGVCAALVKAFPTATALQVYREKPYAESILIREKV